MQFDAKQIRELEEGLKQVRSKYETLMLKYVHFPYQTERGREYGTHGFSRRLKIIARCVEKTFQILPPDMEGLPSRDDLSDAVINIQAFILNAFGSIDNLAWVWVFERDLKKTNGSLYQKMMLSLRKNASSSDSLFPQNFTSIS